MLSTLFISDVHLSNMQDAKARRLLELLKGLNGKSCAGLVLLGDIFDFWIADHQLFIKEYEPLIAEFRRLKAEGVELYYFEGNHDLHLGRFWRDQLGFKVETGPTYMSLGDKTVRLEHGDQMDPEDKGYIFLRWFLRTPLMTWLAHHLPGAVVAWIGRRSSSTSRIYTSEVKTLSEDRARVKIHQHALKAYAERAFDFMITGHVHLRDYYKLTSGAESWNLGTWLEQPGYLLIESGQAKWINLEAGHE